MTNINNVKFKTDIINKLFSKEMSDYLCENISALNDKNFTDIIGLSLLDIHKKYEYAKALKLNELEKECKIAIDNLEGNESELFYLTRISWNTDLEYLLDENIKHDNNRSDILKAINILKNEIDIGYKQSKEGIMPFLDYKKALEFIENDKKSYDYKDGLDYNSLYYYKLEKFKKLSDNDLVKYKDKLNYMYIGDMYLACEYYIVNRKIVFYKEYDYSYKKPCEKLSSLLYHSENLNLPIPYKNGDIIHCNLNPFSANKNMLVLSIGDNKTCCSVQIAYIDQFGKINKGALKHTFMRDNDVFPCVSALYSLEKVDIESLASNERIRFLNISKTH